MTINTNDLIEDIPETGLNDKHKSSIAINLSDFTNRKYDELQ